MQDDRRISVVVLYAHPLFGVGPTSAYHREEIVAHPEEILRLIRDVRTTDPDVEPHAPAAIPIASARVVIRS